MAASLCNDQACRQNTMHAAYNGHLECLRYAHENGRGWDLDTTFIAAYNGHLECLRYAHENRCEWHPKTTWAAAMNGHLECLRYAHENGCEWDPDTTRIAAINGRLECLMYIYENYGDVVTWENANLEDETGMISGSFSKEIRDFIDSVREDWKYGLNRPGYNIKGSNAMF